MLSNSGINQIGSNNVNMHTKSVIMTGKYISHVGSGISLDFKVL